MQTHTVAAVNHLNATGWYTTKDRSFIIPRFKGGREKKNSSTHYDSFSNDSESTLKSSELDCDTADTS